MVAQPAPLGSHRRRLVCARDAAARCDPFRDDSETVNALNRHRGLTTRNIACCSRPRCFRNRARRDPVRKLVAAVVEVKRRNPTWGCPRIAQQVRPRLRCPDRRKPVPPVPPPRRRRRDSLSASRGKRANRSGSWTKRSASTLNGHVAVELGCPWRDRRPHAAGAKHGQDLARGGARPECENQIVLCIVGCVRGKQSLRAR
jgi:hypothetical protein